MEEIKLNTTLRNYSILIGSNLIEKSGELIKDKLSPETVVIVTDKNVGPIYESRLKSSLESQGITCFTYTLNPGEESKNFNELMNIIYFMAEKKLTRSDAVIALGGGVTGDITALAASLYLRGIKLVSMPTTLLSAVDSSVGGKTAIDLPYGKNLVGTFYQPHLVIFSSDTLTTLPYSEFANGMAEVIKYALISDAKLMDTILASTGTLESLPINEIVSTCVKIKKSVVEKDEFDTGLRQILNYGHTFGHAIEKCSNFTVPHGSAVGTGMVLIARASVKSGYCNEEVLENTIKALKLFNLPVSTDYKYEELFDTVLLDKKRKGEEITLVVPEKTGKCRLLPMSLHEASHFLTMALKE